MVVASCVRERAAVTSRCIRVHIADSSTFIVVSTDGVVTEVSNDEYRFLLEMTEVDAAKLLREGGAIFVDMDREKTEVKVRRGYRARADR